MAAASPSVWRRCEDGMTRMRSRPLESRSTSVANSVASCLSSIGFRNVSTCGSPEDAPTRDAPPQPQSASARRVAIPPTMSTRAPSRKFDQ